MEKSIDSEVNNGLLYGSGNKSNNGYRSEEAKQFIEFCVELDNQDDRLKNKDNKTLYLNIDPQLWNPEPIYDSRSAIAKDVVNFRKLDGGAKEADPWAKLYKKIIAKADSKYPQGWDENTIFIDPDLNGFGPWQNAWLLYEGRGTFKGAYAIAIRGTVVSNSPSTSEDAFFHPVSARNFLSKAVQFADSDNASLHSGFAHATFTLLLDDRYGILRALNNKEIPANSRLYVIGHSQGAAMATIVHAFMYYAMRNEEATSQPVFGLKGMGYRLKSYGFAQPKPGNYAFSSDFARITQNEDNAIVINNYIDPVPKVPLTLQSTGDLDNDFKGSSFLVSAVHFVSGFGSTFRGVVSFFAEPFVKKSATGYSYFYNYENIKPIGNDTTASSWDFVPAGHVLMVFGTPGDPSDPFLQHHATTYRTLIGEQLKD
ncbi:MAG TPA: hypothetical protein VHE58_02610 [Burkholderiales bacterium]|nr:hypothetical protein [Burkholderiales bacterium]